MLDKVMDAVIAHYEREHEWPVANMLKEIKRDISLEVRREFEFDCQTSNGVADVAIPVSDVIRRLVG